MAVENNADFFAEEEVKGSRQPTDTPEFTIGTLRKAIPKECFVRGARSRRLIVSTLSHSLTRPPHLKSILRQERSLVRSLGYLIVDLSMIALLFLFSTKIDGTLAPAVSALLPSSLQSVSVVRAAMWVAYWFFQGAVATGVWVIAHECGHQAFSKYQAVNDGVGLVFHSLLLVPYYSWKFSHARHHANTGSVAKD